jgi:hypothetical protein
MKNSILIFLFLFTICVNSQNKDEIIKSKDIEIKNLKDKLQKEEAHKRNISEIEKLKIEISYLKSVIKESNTHFLKEMFEATYNDKYFVTRDLSKVDDSENFKATTALVNSIKIDANENIMSFCNQIIEFNNNYLTLLEIRETVLKSQYEETKVKNAIDRIQKLPKLGYETKLGITKQRLYDLLMNYKESTCVLKTKLDNYKTKSDQIALKQSYEKLENDIRFKDYIYLKQIIIEMKKDVLSYTGADDLNDCIEEKTTPKEIKHEDNNENKQ